MVWTKRFNLVISVVKVIESLRAFREGVKSKQEYLAMYSSVFGGITTDPALMVIPMDDHIVHRGHGVFDTAAIFDGYVICILDIDYCVCF